MNDDDRAAEGSRPEGPPDGPETAPTEVLDPTRRPKRLLRSRDDRMLAGVAGGLGGYFAVDPVIFRIGFAVSVFFGGLGAIAYLALALFVPSEPEPGGVASAAPVQRSRWLAVAAGVAVVLIGLSAAGSLLFWGDWGWGGDGPWGLLFLAAIGAAAYLVLRDREPGGESRPGRTLAIAALAVAGAIGFTILALLAAFAAAVGGGTVIAALVIAIGVLLAIAAFFGGARWLIVPALALAIPLGATAAADVSFPATIGQRHYAPQTRAEVADRYELGIGQLVVDLRRLDWEAQRTPVPVDARLGIGDLVVIVPEGVCVRPDLRVEGGEIQVGARTVDGHGLDGASLTAPQPTPSGAGERDGAPAEPSVDLDAELDIGSLRVVPELDRDRNPIARDEDGERDVATC